MEFVQAIHDLRVVGGYKNWYVQPGGHYLDDARNQIVDKFLSREESDSDWLIFIDDDQTKFTIDTIETLFAKATPSHRVICGWYLSTLPSGIGPVVFNWGEHAQYGEHYIPVSETDIAEAERDDQGYVAVEAAGTGFMALHRSMLTELRNFYPLPTSPFAEEVINGVHCGEDLTICNRIRRLGHSVYIHPDVVVGHMKTLELFPQ